MSKSHQIEVNGDEFLNALYRKKRVFDGWVAGKPLES